MYMRTDDVNVNLLLAHFFISDETNREISNQHHHKEY